MRAKERVVHYQANSTAKSRAIERFIRFCDEFSINETELYRSLKYDEFVFFKSCPPLFLNKENKSKHTDKALFDTLKDNKCIMHDGRNYYMSMLWINRLVDFDINILEGNDFTKGLKAAGAQADRFRPCGVVTMIEAWVDGSVAEFGFMACTLFFDGVPDDIAEEYYPELKLKSRFRV